MRIFPDYGSDISPDTLEALIRQEHRLIPAILNWRRFRSEEALGRAATTALLLRLFAPTTIVISGTGLVALLTVWVAFQQTRLLRDQNDLLTRQATQLAVLNREPPLREAWVSFVAASQAFADSVYTVYDRRGDGGFPSYYRSLWTARAAIGRVRANIRSIRLVAGEEALDDASVRIDSIARVIEAAPTWDLPFRNAVTWDEEEWVGRRECCVDDADIERWFDYWESGPMNGWMSWLRRYTHALDNEAASAELLLYQISAMPGSE